MIHLDTPYGFVNYTITHSRGENKFNCLSLKRRGDFELSPFRGDGIK